MQLFCVPVLGFWVCMVASSVYVAVEVELRCMLII